MTKTKSANEYANKLFEWPQNIGTFKAPVADLLAKEFDQILPINGKSTVPTYQDYAVDF